MPAPRSPSLELNDVHSGLNRTRVAELLRPRTPEEVSAVVRRAREAGRPVGVCGARHAMGGQQFAADGVQLDMSGLDGPISLDAQRGLARIPAGLAWPRLLAALDDTQAGMPPGGRWTFRQKQTGADDLTLGGAASANIHGRVLDAGPLVGDVESLTLVDAEGEVRRVSRREEPDRFAHAVGGYGMFGVMTEVELRLIRRTPVRRRVELGPVDGLAERIEQRVAEGFTLGDFQPCVDPASPDFLREGVFSCYRPEPAAVETGVGSGELSASDWLRLLVLAHSDPARGWAEYCEHYRRTDGQLYWNDRVQLSHYAPDYAERLQAALPSLEPGALMIAELYVPRGRVEGFLAECAADFRRHGTRVIYSTVRFIRRDAETRLAWAREDFACVIFNLRVAHSPAGLAKARREFRRLNDQALERGGSFYLTYHRWATRDQLLSAYPQLPAVLAQARAWDPDGRFTSDWRRHVEAMLGAPRWNPGPEFKPPLLPPVARRSAPSTSQ